MLSLFLDEVFPDKVILLFKHFMWVFFEVPNLHMHKIPISSIVVSKCWYFQSFECLNDKMGHDLVLNLGPLLCYNMSLDIIFYNTLLLWKKKEKKKKKKNKIKKIKFKI